jgi:hypothetical protein
MRSYEICSFSHPAYAHTHMQTLLKAVNATHGFKTHNPPTPTNNAAPKHKNQTNADAHITRRVALASRKARYKQLVCEMNSSHNDAVANKLLEVRAVSSTCNARHR